MDYQDYTTTELVAMANALSNADAILLDPGLPDDFPRVFAEWLAMDFSDRCDVVAELSKWANVRTYADMADNPLDLVTPMLTDEQAELVPMAYPEWAVGVAYAAGRRVRHDGRLWRCVQAHTSQEGWEPPTAPALWVRTSTDEWPEWVQPTGAHDAYGVGDRVTHGGSRWVSTVDANTWEPGVYGWDQA